MWKQLIAPTVFVIAVWVSVSAITNFYILWLDRSYQRELTENLASIRASGELQEEIWRMLAYVRNGYSTAGQVEFKSYFPGAMEALSGLMVELNEATSIPGEAALVDRVEEDTRLFLESIRSLDTQLFVADVSEPDNLAKTAEAIAATCSQIRHLNEETWRKSMNHRDRWSGNIIAWRRVAITLGPFIGIVVGVWIGNRLHRSISQINVILKGATAQWEHRIGERRVDDRVDLAALRERVEEIVERMREVSAELELARRETLRSERLAAVGELAAGVAHELRNPLTAVKLLLQYASQLPEGEALSAEQSRVVLDEIFRMENTIQGLLDFSRPPISQRCLHDLRRTVKRAINLMEGRARQQKVELVTHFPELPIVVDGDPEQLHQICVNLLLNGIEAMENGGHFSVSVEANNVANPTRARIYFRDTGPGIRDEVLERMFEPFVSTKERGTGLGLAICQGIMKQHGGKLWAENLESGAMFTMELPLVVDEASISASLLSKAPAIANSI